MRERAEFSADLRVELFWEGCGREVRSCRESLSPENRAASQIMLKVPPWPVLQDTPPGISIHDITPQACPVFDPCKTPKDEPLATINTLIHHMQSRWRKRHPVKTIIMDHVMSRFAPAWPNILPIGGKVSSIASSGAHLVQRNARPSYFLLGQCTRTGAGHF